MLWLLWFDLSVQHRSPIKLLPVLALVTSLHYFGGPVEAIAFPAFSIATLACYTALRAAREDELADVWTHLRVLPISPVRAVIARYLSVLLLVLAAGLAVAVPLILLTRHTWAISVAVGAGLGLTLTALMNAVYFRFGYRTAASEFLTLLGLGVSAAGLWLVHLSVSAGQSPEATLSPVLRQVWAWTGSGAAAGLLPAAAIAALYVGSCIYAAATFAGKELL